jgi:hypothetical protein
MVVPTKRCGHRRALSGRDGMSLASLPHPGFEQRSVGRIARSSAMQGSAMHDSECFPVLHGRRSSRDRRAGSDQSCAASEEVSRRHHTDVDAHDLQQLVRCPGFRTTTETITGYGSSHSSPWNDDLKWQDATILGMHCLHARPRPVLKLQAAAHLGCCAVLLSFGNAQRPARDVMRRNIAMRARRQTMPAPNVHHFTAECVMRYAHTRRTEPAGATVTHAMPACYAGGNTGRKSATCHMSPWHVSSMS